MQPHPGRSRRARNKPKRNIPWAFSAAGGENTALSAAFADALRELGWVEGRNVVFEYRYAENRPERLPELAADLVRLKVDVIAAAGTLAPLAAKRTTATIPIVMTAAGDPLGEQKHFSGHFPSLAASNVRCAGGLEGRVQKSSAAAQLFCQARARAAGAN